MGPASSSPASHETAASLGDCLRGVGRMEQSRRSVDRARRQACEVCSHECLHSPNPFMLSDSADAVRDAPHLARQLPHGSTRRARQSSYDSCGGLLRPGRVTSRPCGRSPRGSALADVKHGAKARAREAAEGPCERPSRLAGSTDGLCDGLSRGEFRDDGPRVVSARAEQVIDRSVSRAPRTRDLVARDVVARRRAQPPVGCSIRERVACSTGSDSHSGASFVMKTLGLRAGLPDAFPLPGDGRLVREVVWSPLPNALVHGQHRKLVRQAQTAFEAVQQGVPLSWGRPPGAPSSTGARAGTPC